MTTFVPDVHLNRLYRVCLQSTLWHGSFQSGQLGWMQANQVILENVILYFPFSIESLVHSLTVHRTKHLNPCPWGPHAWNKQLCATVYTNLSTRLYQQTYSSIHFPYSVNVGSTLSQVWAGIMHLICIPQWLDVKVYSKQWTPDRRINEKHNKQMNTRAYLSPLAKANFFPEDQLSFA